MKFIEYFMYDAVKLEQMAFENADKVGGQNASSSASQAASAGTNSSADLVCLQHMRSQACHFLHADMLY
jgi:hypothetical protein